MGTRRSSREYALQMLFQWDITRDAIEQIQANFWDSHDEPENVVQFASLLVNRTIEHSEEIDAMIQSHAEHWRLDRMAVVDRNVLRLATQELMFDKETPATVVINEAIEIVRRYGSEDSPQFINGILDSIRKALE